MKIKEEILAALEHSEGEEGLYLENFYILHEEDQRPKVSGTQLEILDALKSLIDEGKVVTEDLGEQVAFKLNK